MVGRSWPVAVTLLATAIERLGKNSIIVFYFRCETCKLIVSCLDMNATASLALEYISFDFQIAIVNMIVKNIAMI